MTVIALAAGTGISSSAPELAIQTPREAGTRVSESDPAGADSCRAARKALRYYVTKEHGWRARMGAGDMNAGLARDRGHISCPRYLASLWRSKARAARVEYRRWHRYHWRWDLWLPDKWARIGACETGYGQRPGRWDWNSGTYQGAFGFYHGSWDAFVPYADRKARPYPSEAYNATPRQQYEVALAIYRRFGLSGWGCRNA